MIICDLIWRLDYLATSYELDMPLFDYSCKPHVLTEVTIILFISIKLRNAHLQ